MGPPSPRRMMSQASDEANVVANGAAAATLVAVGAANRCNTRHKEDTHVPEMKMAVRKANSSRLKKKDR